MPGVFLLSPAGVFADPNQQAAASNATLVASGSTIFSGFGSKQLTLVVNIKASPTGTTPTLTFTLQEVDPGDLTTVIGGSVSTASLNSITTATITLPVIMGSAVKVSWVITGSSPSFTQVYATLSAKMDGPLVAQDSNGNDRSVLVDSSGRLVTAGAGTAGSPAAGVLSVQGVASGTALPVSVASLPLPSGAATSANQTTLGSQTTKVNDGTNTAAVKAASTAAVAADPALVVAVSPNNSVAITAASLPLPTGAATSANQTTLGNQTTKVNDGTNTAAVKAASTAAVAADPALVVAISPNNTPVLPSGAATSANQTNATQKTQVVDGSGNVAPAGDTVARASFEKITDGTNTAAVKAASTAPVATDPALVVSISPNSTLTAVNPSVGSNNAAIPTSSTQVGGSDGTNLQAARVFDADSGAGTQFVLGAILRKSASGGSVEAGTSSDPLRVDPTGTTTQPVSAASLPLPAGAATSANQTTLGSQTSKINDGTNTAAVKAASTAAVAADPALVVAVSPNNSVAITAAALPLPTGAATSANQTTLGSQTTKVNDGTNTAAVKAASTAAVAADPALVVAISPNNTPVLPAGAATSANQTNATQKTQVVDGAGNVAPAGDTVARASFEKITDGTNTAAVKAASTAAVAADPALVVSLSPNNPTPGTADVNASGALNALNAAVTITHPGLQFIGVFIAAGTLAGIVSFEQSYDGGTTWVAVYGRNISTDFKSSSFGFINPNPATPLTIVGGGGAGMTRVRVSTFTSGTATATIRASDTNDVQPLFSGTSGQAAPPSIAQVGGSDSSALVALRMKTASTAAVATDPALVVAVSPNNSVAVTAASLPLPTGAATSANQTNASQKTQVVDGSGNVQPSLDTVARSGFVRVTDGTNTQPTGDAAARKIFVQPTDGTNLQAMFDVVARAGFVKLTDGTSTTAVKAASTAAVAADPAVVVAISPNNTLPVSTIDVTNTGNLAALNNAVQVALEGRSGAGFQLAAGTLIGTIIPEVSFDGATTWVATYFDDPTTGNKANSIVFASSNTATARSITTSAGASHARVRVSAFTSGTASCQVRASLVLDPSILPSGQPGVANPNEAIQVGGTDGTLLRALSTDTNGIVYAATLGEAIARARVASAYSSNISGETSTNAATRAGILATAFTDQTTNAQRSVSSASANDASAGTGARTIRITYYSISAGVVTGPFTETITMNGTTTVNTASTTIAFLEKVEVMTAGSGLVNAGIISIFGSTAGGGGTIASIAASSNISRWAHHFVVSGRTCMIFDVYAMNDSTSGNTPRITIETLDLGTANAAERAIATYRLDGRQLFTVTSRVPIAVVGPARIRAYVTPANTPVQETTFEARYLEI